MLKVRAIGDEGKVVGYCDHIRRRGNDEFVLSDVSKFSATYMEELDKEAFAEAREVVKKLKIKLSHLGVEFAELATTKALQDLLREAEKAQKGKKSEGADLDREAIKAQLVEFEVDFAGNAKTETLAALLEKTLAEKEQ